MAGVQVGKGGMGGGAESSCRRRVTELDNVEEEVGGVGGGGRCYTTGDSLFGARSGAAAAQTPAAARPPHLSAV